MMMKIDAQQFMIHKLPMRLVDYLVEADEDSILCELEVREDGLLDEAGVVPACVGLEYMAQTIACFSGYHAMQQGGEPKLGLLLGTRRFESDIQSFKCGDCLKIHANRLIMSENGMASFECKVENAVIVQRATVAVFEPLNVADFFNEV